MEPKNVKDCIKSLIYSSQYKDLSDCVYMTCNLLTEKPQLNARASDEVVAERLLTVSNAEENPWPPRNCSYSLSGNS
jgi:hypothetical protein